MTAQTDDVAAQPLLGVVESADAGDVLTIYAEDGATVVDIVSPRGIGGAQVRFTPETGVGAVRLRFHLQGLEQTILDNGSMQLAVSVSSQAPHAVSQVLTTAAGATSLREGDALWAIVELIPASGAPPTIPLADGSIDVLLPAGIVDAQHTVLTVQWIDFYR